MTVGSTARQAIACCWLGIAGCAHETAASAPIVTAPATDPEQDLRRTRAHVWALASAEPIDPTFAEHFRIAIWARDAVIDGNLDQIREPLQAFAQYRYQTIDPADWTGAIADLQRASASVANAQTLEAAAAGVARMAKVCGDCHAENAARALPDRLVQTPEWFGAQAMLQRMDSHQWVAERLWYGLVDPSDAAWDAGAQALSTIEPRTSGGFAAAFGALRTLSEAARAARTADSRADVYGQLLSTCANCHHAHRDLLRSTDSGEHDDVILPVGLRARGTQHLAEIRLSAGTPLSSTSAVVRVRSARPSP